MKNSPEIIFGVPTNRRLRKDIAPMLDALKIRETTSGKVESDVIGNRAQLVNMRVQDIARAMLTGDVQMGIAANDVLLEAELGMKRYQSPYFYTTMPMALKEIDVVDVCLLVREEDREKWVTAPSTIAYMNSMKAKKILAAYPEIAKYALCKKRQELYDEKVRVNNGPLSIAAESLGTERLDVEKCDSSSEKKLRESPEYVIGTIDLVRSGVTAAENGLIVMGPPLVSSRPGFTSIFPTPYLEDDRKKLNKSLYQREGPIGSLAREVCGLLESLCAGQSTFANKPLFPEYKRNETIESIDSRLTPTNREERWEIVEACRLPESELRKVGQVASRCLYVFKNSQEVEASGFCLEVKRQLTQALIQEESMNARSLKNQLGTGKFSGWLGFDATQPFVIAEAPSTEELEALQRIKDLRRGFPATF